MGIENAPLRSDDMVLRNGWIQFGHLFETNIIIGYSRDKTYAATSKYHYCV